MDTLFMTSENSITSDSHRPLLNLLEKINLKKSDKQVALSNLTIYCTWKNPYKYNEFKISAPTWNNKFELPDGSYCITDIQNYFEYIIKKNEALNDNPLIRIYELHLKTELHLKLNQDIIQNT